MKKINLKFIGLGINNNYQANIKVYDGNCLIFNRKTFNGKIDLFLECNKRYKVVAEFLCQKNVNFIFVNDYIDNYTFIFNSSMIIQNNNTVTFTLTDFNYENLPIMKGEIILWQR